MSRDKEERLRNLRSLIGEHDQRYYKDANPTISDREYDRLKREMEDLEAEIDPLGLFKEENASPGSTGSVSELRLMELAFETDAVLDKTVEDVMAAPLPTIGAGQPVALAVEMLESCSAMLVLDGGRPRAVVSSTDVLNFLSDAQGA